MSATQTALNPELHRLLQFCAMDRTWVRGEGIWLHDQDGRVFLDCYSQYGAVPLGHNAPCATEAVTSALRNAEPAMVQPFAAPNAVLLAQRLVDLAPGEMSHCVFTNSGAETVEAAIKLCRLKSNRPIILSCHNAYHGKTSGAMAVSGNSSYGSIYGISAPGFSKIQFGDANALAKFLETRGKEVAAFFVEPIQGEAGVQLPPENYLSDVRQLCTQYDVPLVLDEIQTGLGRTGRLFCCESNKIAPDLLLTSKALGGGLFPIGACLTTDKMWSPKFALTHSSTFANNNISSKVGLIVLSEISKPGFCKNVVDKGEYLRQRLQNLAKQYPKMIRQVRGRGLLLAIEFDPNGFDDGLFTAYLRHQNLLAYGFSATLAELESIIMMPSLGHPLTIRIMPPLTITLEQCDRVICGLGRVLNAFSEHMTETLVRAMGGLSPTTEQKPDLYLPIAKRLVSNGSDIGRFAFLIHYTQPEDVLITDPALASLSDGELARYCSFISDMPPGVVYEIEQLRSLCGSQAKGWLIAMGMLPEEMYKRGYKRVVGDIKRGVDLAGELGAQVVGLGAFTSIFSRQGKSVVGRGPSITTGNTFTALMAYRAIMHVADQIGLTTSETKIGIVGARGAVASLCAQLLAREKPRSIVLIGNANASRRHLESIRTLLRNLTDCPIKISARLDDLYDCNAILSATSSRFPVLDDIELRANTIICDVARPADTGPISRSRSDLIIVDGGLVALPDSSLCFGKGNIQGFPNGVQLACLSETMLLALAGETRDFGIGAGATLEDVDYLSRLADIHGFSLALQPLEEQMIKPTTTVNMNLQY